MFSTFLALNHLFKFNYFLIKSINSSLIVNWRKLKNIYYKQRMSNTITDHKLKEELRFDELLIHKTNSNSISIPLSANGWVSKTDKSFRN
jgi:hypothetical protein